MTDNLILYELQNIHEALTKTKKEYTLNFRMIANRYLYLYLYLYLSAKQVPDTYTYTYT